MARRVLPILLAALTVVLAASGCAGAQLPDLTAAILDVSIQIGATVGAGDVAEGCAESTSGVDLLRFGVESFNVGAVDFVLGDPQCPRPCSEHPAEVCGNPQFICSPADGHNHPHYQNYLRYELLDANGQTVVVGHKQGYCLRDTDCPQPNARFTCNNQGLSVGCGDVYGSNLGCQYLDITDVPAGAYELRITTDPLDLISEEDETNNVAIKPVTIPPRNVTTTTTITTSTTVTTATVPRPTTTSTTTTGTGPTTTGSPTSTTVVTSSTIPETTTSASTSTIPPTTTTVTAPPVTTTTIPSPPGATTRVSVAGDGSQALQESIHPALSADGRFVAFESRAANLVAADTNRLDDVFVHDRATGVVELVSVASDGSPARGSSEVPSLSVDGRLVAFASNAANLVAGDTNNVSDVFVRDRVAGTTVRVSVTSEGSEGDDESLNPVISTDGRVVAFESRAKNLVVGAHNQPDVLVHDLVTGATEQASVATDGTHADASSSNPALSADGRAIAFESRATNLAGDDTNGASDIFVHDRVTGATARVSMASDGGQADGDSYRPAISADGVVVVFESRATNLVPNDTNGATDVFARDRASGITMRVSVGTGGVQADGNSFLAGISGDGRLVIFTSDAANLVPGDTNQMPDVFVYDRIAGTTTRVSIGAGGVEANGRSLGRAISHDGIVVAFQSEATNLGAGDTNGWVDVFVRERAMQAMPASCVADADCSDGSACTMDRCAGGQCTMVQRGGLDGVLCEFGEMVAAPLCGSERAPRRLERGEHRILRKAAKRLARLPRLTGKPKRVAFVLRQVEKALGRVDRRLVRAAQRRKISADCRTTMLARTAHLRAAVTLLGY